MFPGIRVSQMTFLIDGNHSLFGAVLRYLDVLKESKGVLNSSKGMHFERS